ncbi:contractile injection system tape measure protein (plasmid) [Enterobacter bugandensis]|uniref:contractile injection system tape measure protein n=1 Tax=Enterobacter bugandensis TaxID=881260 RepID=UPI00283A8C73|nr:contractile injection system tape measure protein [Enterobacter bugandensis]WMU75412.1 contractile injection system tape measure protein [Enterobacter bugandensis]
MNRAFTGRLHLRLHTREPHAQALQQRCSRWFYARLQSELTRVLTRFAMAEEQDCIIDRLVIDVGEIPLSRFEETMSERVSTQLQAALRHCHWSRDAKGILRGSPVLQTGQPGMQQASRPSGNTLRTAGGTVREKASSPNDADEASPVTPFLPRTERFRQLLHYLDTGQANDVRPWLNRQSRDAWLMEALPHAEWPAGLSPRKELALRVLQPSGWQRLMTTWSPPALVRLLLWLTTSPSLPSPPKAESARYAPLAALLALQHHPETWSDAGVMQALAELPGRVWPGHPPKLIPRDRPGRRDLSQPSAFSAPSLRADDSVLHDWLAVLAATPLPLKAQVRAGPDNAQVTDNASPDAPRPIPPVLLSANAKSYAAPAEVSETVWVANAGLVLLWPLLPLLFAQHGWVKDGQFVDSDVCWQAFSALDWLVWGDADLAEWRAPCARLLCGIDSEIPFTPGPVDPAQQDELDAWLVQILRAIPPLSRCDISTLRELFLQRPGILQTEGGIRLTVDPHAADVLLYDLPWPLTPVVLPWLALPFGVDWKI